MLTIPLCFGIVLVLFGTRIIFLAEESKDWQQTSAMITDINLVETTSSNTNNENPIDISLVYQYQVDKQEYQSNKYSYSDGKTVKSRLENKNAAQLWLKNSVYKVGQKISIYYNPSNPSQAVIKTGSSIWTFIPFPVGIFLCLLFGIIISILKFPNPDIENKNESTSP